MFLIKLQLVDKKVKKHFKYYYGNCKICHVKKRENGFIHKEVIFEITPVLFRLKNGLFWELQAL